MASGCTHFGPSGVPNLAAPVVHRYPAPVMPNLHDDPAALKALQDDLYREKILRARRMTTQERVAEVFELSNHQFGMMLAGAMHRLGTRDEAAGWQEVSRWMQRLDRVREAGRYMTEKPADK